MSTGRELVSQIRSVNKLINADNSITDRAIYNEIRYTASLLIKRETNLRRLWQSPNLFTTIECIKMIAVPIGECCDYRSHCQISRSEKKIPKIAEGLFGLLVQSVFNIDKSESYKYSTPSRYSNMLKLQVKNKNKYFWIFNGYLYVTDEFIEKVNLTAYFDEDFNPNDYNSCDCESNDCVNPMDREFKLPSYLEKSVLDMVNENIMKIYFRHINDENPNIKDEEK